MVQKIIGQVNMYYFIMCQKESTKCDGSTIVKTRSPDHKVELQNVSKGTMRPRGIADDIYKVERMNVSTRPH